MNRTPPALDVPAAWRDERDYKLQEKLNLITSEEILSEAYVTAKPLPPRPVPPPYVINADDPLTPAPPPPLTDPEDVVAQLLEIERVERVMEGVTGEPMPGKRFEPPPVAAPFDDSEAVVVTDIEAAVEQFTTPGVGPAKQEEEPVATAKEVAEYIGKEQLKAIKEAAKPQGSVEEGFVLAQDATAAIMEAASLYQEVSLNLRRRDPLTQQYASIQGMQSIDPNLLNHPGLDELLRNWSGGGDYEVLISAPGRKPIKVRRVLEGERLEPLPSRGKGTTPGAGALAPSAGALPTSGIPGQATGPIAWQGTPGQPWTWSARQGSGMPAQPMDPMMAMMLMMMQSQESRRAAPADESESLKALKAQLDEERRERAEEKRRHEFEALMAANSEKVAQLTAIVQQSQQAAVAAATVTKEEKRQELLLALLPALAPIVQGFIGKSDALAGIFAQVLAAQQASSAQNMGVLTQVMNRPGPEDRMDRMVGTFSNLMSAQMTSMSGLLQSGLLDKGGDSPAVQIVSQILDTAGQVAKVAFAAKMGALGGGDDGDDMKMSWEQATPPQLTSGPSAPPEPPKPAAPILEVVEAEERVAGLPEASGALPVQETEGEVVVPVDENGEVDISAAMRSDTAFAKILDLIENGGDLREIAVRMWRHAGAGDEQLGHPLAKNWVEEPVRVGQYILVQLRIPDERIVAVTKAIDELKAFIKAGGDPEAYAIFRKRRKSRVASPVLAAVGDEALDESEELGEATLEPQPEPVSALEPAPPA